jgi:hypothetical protein
MRRTRDLRQTRSHQSRHAVSRFLPRSPAAQPTFALLEHLRPRDTLVLWRVDRLGRSLRHLIDIAADLDHRDVALVTLRESLDTGTPVGG